MEKENMNEEMDEGRKQKYTYEIRTLGSKMKVSYRPELKPRKSQRTLVV